MTYLPFLVALCGNPEAGKSTAQTILFEEFGLTPIDDGRACRDTGKAMFGLTEAQVTTQEGKAEYVTVCGQQFQVRDLLGTVGELMERRYGEQIFPEAAIRRALADWRVRQVMAGARGYTFGSVRKTQGKTYRSHERGHVLEIWRDGCQPSPYAFDRYDRSYISMAVENPLPFGAEPTPGLRARFRDNLLLTIKALM